MVRCRAAWNVEFPSRACHFSTGYRRMPAPKTPLPAKPAAAPPADTAPPWDAWGRELADMRTECTQLYEIFDRIWDEMDQIRSELTLRTQQHDQLRKLAEQQQQQLAARNDGLQQAMARIEERQQQLAEIFSELLTLRDERRRPF